ncbi:hypothetical protein LG634_19590 [Streptomyces bambusae]|uniref:hypothetical protein n=1 Tax=Streptomyces bambusae TaxID=1550616 RepID=UPI001CFD096B|nr:hypothetical protein [Streptomyces bambusae]MCB5167032.1 hypothetical protein [Streptomyces bambusae]
MPERRCGVGGYGLFGDDGLLASHVAAHIVFYIAAALHIGLVLEHQLVDRDHLLHRML